MVLQISAWLLLQGGGVVTAPPNQAPEQTAQEEYRQRIFDNWRTELTRICEVEKIEGMVVNLQGAVVLKAWSEPHGVAGMRMLGRALQAKWTQVNGVQTFGFAHYDSEPRDSSLWSALRDLDPATKRRLTSGNLTLADLGPVGGEVALACALDPAMATIMLERGGSARLQANFAVHGRWVDPNTGKARHVFFDTGADGGPPVSPEPDDPGTPLFAYAPLKPHVGSGPLDYGSGSVMTLEQFRNRAQDVFGARYYLDSRLRDEYVYVRGTMDQETFELVYREVATAVPPVRMPEYLTATHEEIARLIDEMGISDADAATLERMGLSLGDVLDGKTITAGELASQDPSLRARLRAFGIPDDATIQLQGGLELSIDPGGWRDVLPGVTMNGRMVRRMASNRLVFGIIAR